MIEDLGCFDCLKQELEILYHSFIRVCVDSLNSFVSELCSPCQFSYQSLTADGQVLGPELFQLMNFHLNLPSHLLLGTLQGS